jgi:DNA-binding transcriptional MerR regulator
VRGPIETDGMLAAPELTAFYTVGDIARECGVEKDRVLYVVRTRNIVPSGRAANIRLFSEAAKNRVHNELARIRTKRQGGQP